MSLIFGLISLALATSGPDDFTMTIPVSPETPEGQQLIAVRAVEICGTRYPSLARYRFAGDEHIAPDGTRRGSFRVNQELTCSASSATAPRETGVETSAPTPAGWQASSQDEADARAATMAYFGAFDAGDAARVYGMLSAGNRAMESLGDRAEAIGAFRAQAGTPGTHRIVRLTWYVNPAGAPVPGVYVATDYERAYSGLLANCGYLVWYREAAGRYALVREETGVVARGSPGEAPADLAQARAMAGCRAG